MVKFNQLTNEERSSIINLHKYGHTQRYISEKINKKSGRNMESYCWLQQR